MAESKEIRQGLVTLPNSKKFEKTSGNFWRRSHCNHRCHEKREAVLPVPPWPEPHKHRERPTILLTLKFVAVLRKTNSNALGSDSWTGLYERDDLNLLSGRHGRKILIHGIRSASRRSWKMPFKSEEQPLESPADWGTRRPKVADRYIYRNLWRREPRPKVADQCIYGNLSRREHRPLVADLLPGW